MKNCGCGNAFELTVSNNKLCKSRAPVFALTDHKVDLSSVSSSK